MAALRAWARGTDPTLGTGTPSPASPWTAIRRSAPSPAVRAGSCSMWQRPSPAPRERGPARNGWWARV